MLSYGGQLVLINSVLTSHTMFMFSFLEMPQGIRKRVDFLGHDFFGQIMGCKYIGLLSGILFVDQRSMLH
jgi:hypothetical protein